MKRVTGIGGIFFHARDPATLRAWYQKHLGIDVQEWGGAAFTWTDAEGNHRVADLRGLVAVLKAEGCNVLEKVEESEYGKSPGSSTPRATRPNSGNRRQANDVSVEFTQ